MRNLRKLADLIRFIVETFIDALQRPSGPATPEPVRLEDQTTASEALTRLVEDGIPSHHLAVAFDTDLASIARWRLGDTDGVTADFWWRLDRLLWAISMYQPTLGDVSMSDALERRTNHSGENILECIGHGLRYRRTIDELVTSVAAVAISEDADLQPA